MSGIKPSPFLGRAIVFTTESFHTSTRILIGYLCKTIPFFLAGIVQYLGAAWRLFPAFAIPYPIWRSHSPFLHIARLAAHLFNAKNDA